MWECVECGEVMEVFTAVVPRRFCLRSSGIMVGGRQVHTLPGHSYSMHSVDFSPDGKRVASSGWNNNLVKIWSVATGDLVGSFVGAR